MLCMVLAWRWPYETGKVPQSELAQLVQHIAQELAHSERSAGALPQQLRGLKTVPAEALEMAMEDYQARLLEPALELFYLPLSRRDFVLIGRYDGVAWMYASGEAHPLRQVPAYSP